MLSRRFVKVLALEGWDEDMKSNCNAGSGGYGKHLADLQISEGSLGLSSCGVGWFCFEFLSDTVRSDAQKDIYGQACRPRSSVVLSF